MYCYNVHVVDYDPVLSFYIICEPVQILEYNLQRFFSDYKLDNTLASCFRKVFFPFS